MNAPPGPWALYPMGDKWYVTRERVFGRKDQESFGPFAEDLAGEILANLTNSPCEACREAYYLTLRWSEGNITRDGFWLVYEKKMSVTHHALIDRLQTALKGIALRDYRGNEPQDRIGARVALYDHLSPSMGT